MGTPHLIAEVKAAGNRKDLDTNEKGVIEEQLFKPALQMDPRPKMKYGALTTISQKNGKLECEPVLVIEFEEYDYDYAKWLKEGYKKS